MNKIKVEIYQEILRDVSQNFEGTGKFIKQKNQETTDPKKISVKELISFFMYVKACVFSVIACYY